MMVGYTDVPSEGSLIERTASPLLTQPEDTPAVAPSLWQRLANPKTLLSFILAAALLVAVWRGMGLDWVRIWGQVQQADLTLFLLALGVYNLTFVPRALRWRRMLCSLGHPLPASILGRIIWLSWFINHLVPAKMGDFYRGLILRRNEQVSFSLATGSVLAERVVDMLTLMGLAVVGGLFFVRGALLNQMHGVIISAAVLLTLLVGALILIRQFDSALLARFPQQMQERFERFQRGIFQSVKPVPLVALLTGLAWAAEWGRFYLVAQAMHVELGLAQLIFVFAAAALLLAAPTPGGLGAVEGGMVGMMVLLGVPADTAAAVAILDRLISYWLVLVPAGLYYLTHPRFRL